MNWAPNMKAETYFITVTIVVWFEGQQELLMRKGYVVCTKGELALAPEHMPYPFHSQDLINTSPWWLPYNSFDFSSENLLSDQLIIPNWYFSLFLSLVCLILYGYFEEKFCLGHSWELKSWGPIYAVRNNLNLNVKWCNILWLGLGNF